MHAIKIIEEAENDLANQKVGLIFLPWIILKVLLDSF